MQPSCTEPPDAPRQQGHALSFNLRHSLLRQGKIVSLCLTGCPTYQAPSTRNAATNGSSTCALSSTCICRLARNGSDDQVGHLWSGVFSKEALRPQVGGDPCMEKDEENRPHISPDAIAQAVEAHVSSLFPRRWWQPECEPPASFMEHIWHPTMDRKFKPLSPQTS